ncbi:class I SAM-dependent methyltransferase [Propionivibrio sp.]|uniref:class I SAM-dependent methyltransferase n=1 Tax=Propionivibrio sp. TaxID=2212460 RepID=UPI0026227AF0|nr:class I SAM-dependent methyltransferase [Propionivibrio sp.]
MDKATNIPSGFYESFWEDTIYQQAYAFDSAVRDRFPAIKKVWGEMVLPNRVLDFGSGNGVLSYWMHCNGFGTSILGVDVSNSGVNNARKTFSGNGLHFETIDYLSNTTDREQFDVVVSSHVLEHVPNPETTLSQLRKLSDWFVFEVPIEICLWQNISHALRRTHRQQNDLGHVNFWTTKSFRAFLEENGFLIVRDYHYASAPYSPYNTLLKRTAERLLLAGIGLTLYSRLMATHYIVLARLR